MNGNDLVFGNDFDYPIRDRLPMAFNMFFGMVKRWIDPAMNGDPYADKPYIYSPALATWSQFCIGTKGPTEEQKLKKDTIVEEGLDEEAGKETREKFGIPATGDARKKHFQDESHRKAFSFIEGTQYMADFGDSYLNFNGK